MMRWLLLFLASIALAGCLEVDQYPRYADGAYAGKPDALPPQAHFHGDRLAWNAAIVDRNHRQDEYERARPSGQEGHPEAETR